VNLRVELKMKPMKKSMPATPKRREAVVSVAVQKIILRQGIVTSVILSK